MYIPGVICILAALFVMNRLRDTPQSMGLPPIEKYRDDFPTNRASKEETELSTKELLFEYVIKNKYIWMLTIAYFLIYVIRTAINDWSMVYLIEVKNYTMREAGICLFWFEWGGLFGSLTAGWASDLLFNGRRNPVNVLFTVAILFLIFAFGVFSHASIFLDSVYIFLFGFFVFGPQMLIGMAAAELSHKNATATATGFIGFFAYLGAAAAGAPLGAIAQTWGWDIYLATLFVCGTIGVLVMLPLWSIKANPKESESATA